MLPHKLALCLLLILFTSNLLTAQKKPPSVAVVVDERLGAVRATPQLNGQLVRRLGRGRLVAVRSTKTSRDGIAFLLVNVTSRTHGWIQREAVASPSRAGDDQRLLRLIESSEGFDRLSRARIFLDHFTRSPLRPDVLLLLGDTAEKLAAKLSTDAARRLKNSGGEAPEFSYYLNFTGLDRYNRLRVTFVFDKSTKRFHYDGAAWRELIRRYPRSSAAGEAQKRLALIYSQLRGELVEFEHGVAQLTFMGEATSSILRIKRCENFGRVLSNASPENNCRRTGDSTLNCKKSAAEGVNNAQTPSSTSV